MNEETPLTSNDATPGSDASSGDSGFESKLWFKLTFSDDITYGAPEGNKTPASSVDDVGSILLLAPSTECSSNTLFPSCSPPSMS